MHKEFLMGNEAIALGALAAGVNLVAGYPGTPSTEVLETVAARRTEATYVEWSINEKAALEVAAGAAYAGARAMMTCKQVGLNVATDPLMSLEYIGVKGGLVLMVADDPGPISSQTEQDTRTFASFSKIPVFDPSSVASDSDVEVILAANRNKSVLNYRVKLFYTQDLVEPIQKLKRKLLGEWIRSTNFKKTNVINIRDVIEHVLPINAMRSNSFVGTSTRDHIANLIKWAQ